MLHYSSIAYFNFNNVFAEGSAQSESAVSDSSTQQQQASDIQSGRQEVISMESNNQDYEEIR